jgi:HPt (histidine-containing phosphotransfer) domain-containing protein
MDMQMPVMDGYTATARLRAAGYTRPIVALTANAMREDAHRCALAGCDEYVPKPVDMPALLRTLLRLVGRPIAPPASSSAPSASSTPSTPPPEDDPILRDLTARFLQGLSSTLAVMTNCLAEQRFPELGALAHRLAGAGGSYGFPQITAAARELETAARQPAASAQLQSLLDNLAKAIAEAQAASPNLPPAPSATST